MSPSRSFAAAGALGFPRVSGDEPADDILNALRKAFSPRERG